MRVQTRNRNFFPELRTEGTFRCPLPAPPRVEGKPWDYLLKPYERLYYHQTLSSVRYCRRYIPNKNIPRDSLEFRLLSRYDHSKESFPQKVDQILQRETCGSSSGDIVTFRVLRNVSTHYVQDAFKLGHPLRIGGVKEHISPHSVKLINSGPHNQVVNNGYSRQSSDGNYFRY